MPAVLFNKTPLSVNYQPSQVALIEGNRLVLDFEIEVLAGAPAVVQWYIEASAGAAGVAQASWSWFRELSDEPAAGGNIAMNEIVRTIGINGGGALPVGTHRFKRTFEFLDQLARLQARATAGNVRLTVRAPRSDQAIS